ncbi:C40 family peptidase [Flavobacterium sp. J27]|uniref:C40 family peptidase n=1 Tax=Flavobacterium sp. J27 TaxID=2060419 RepID=UPI0010317254|nr:C40 family peptidase [Flavobacterium sp. J27]
MKGFFLVVFSFICIPFFYLNFSEKKDIQKGNSKTIIRTQKVKEKVLFDKQSNQEIDRAEIVSFAKSFLDVPYVYSSQDPKKGFDCSGFVNYIFKNFAIQVPRVSSGFKNFGKPIPVDSVALGDILVFTGYRDSTSIGHVGIVCEADGLQSKFIHASSGKAMKVTISDLHSAHYSKRFYQAIDVINP